MTDIYIKTNIKMEIMDNKLKLTKQDKKKIKIIQTSELIRTDEQPIYYKLMGIDEQFIHKINVLLGHGNSTYYFEVY